MIVKFEKRKSKKGRSKSLHTESCRFALDSIIQGDALKTLKTLPGSSIDLVVTDPPYGYFFNKKKWDRGVPPPQVWAECLRVLKPGAVMFVMSSPRQDCLYQMLANLRQAGFLLNFTSIYWAYSSGFPKAANIARMVDERLGAPRLKKSFGAGWINRGIFQGLEPAKRYDATPRTRRAATLDGAYAGFQPKPAVEVIIVAMKPLSEKTFVQQALVNRKGITWLDDARIPEKSALCKANRNAASRGRFPANLLVSDDAIGNELKFSRYFSLDAWWEKRIAELPEETRRSFPFLIVPKASQTERNEGLGSGNPNDRANTHPTVKPLKLMSFLITLASRPGDVVLDPFVGSGTTCIIARLLDRHYIGVEREAEYVQIARCRLAARKKVCGSAARSGS